MKIPSNLIIQKATPIIFIIRIIVLKNPLSFISKILMRSKKSQMKKARSHKKKSKLLSKN